MQSHLLKEGIEGIHNYREDYEQARRLYSTAEQHLIEAKRQREDVRSSCALIAYANNALNDLVVLANRRIRELLAGLQETYKVLGQ